MTHWIFGYGSLICPDSRARTGLTGAALPVITKGFQRHWSVAVNYGELSVLGIRPGTPEDEVGGVLFALDDTEFAGFDAREVEYQRHALSPEALQPLSGHSLPDGHYWAYVPEATQSPHPIPQSYLDVVLRGCLEIGEDFAHHFIRNTGSWKPRLADRHEPQYPRPLKPEHRAVWPKIDRVLADFNLHSD